MPKFTFEITPAQRRLMDGLPQVNWSEVLRRAVEREARNQELARHIDEELSDPDVEALSKLVKEGMGQRWRGLVRKHRG